MKVLLPSVAAVLVGLVLMWPQIQGQDERFELGFASLSARQVDTLSMINARYFGLDGRNQPFAVTADTAREIAPGERLIEMVAPKADLTRADGSWLVLGADMGYYRQEQNTLDLEGNVNLFHDAGYEIHTKRAHIDLMAQMARGVDPVHGHGPFGELEAEGFELYDKGEVIHFTGKVRVLIRPDAARTSR